MVNRFLIGGGFERGGGSQEESLFFCSDLHQRLYPHGQWENRHGKIAYYYSSENIMEHELQTDKANAYYTKNVRFFATPQGTAGQELTSFAHCDLFQAGVITTPAYDLRLFKKFNDIHCFLTEVGKKKYPQLDGKMPYSPEHILAALRNSVITSQLCWRSDLLKA
jgi:hypothetical protein